MMPCPKFKIGDLVGPKVQHNSPNRGIGLIVGFKEIPGVMFGKIFVYHILCEEQLIKVEYSFFDGHSEKLV